TSVTRCWAWLCCGCERIPVKVLTLFAASPCHCQISMRAFGRRYEYSAAAGSWRLHAPSTLASSTLQLPASRSASFCVLMAMTRSDTSVVVVSYVLKVLLAPTPKMRRRFAVDALPVAFSALTWRQTPPPARCDQAYS